MLNLPHNVGLSVRLNLPHNVGLSVRLTLPHNAAKLIFFYKSPTLLERFNLTQKAALWGSFN